MKPSERQCKRYCDTYPCDRTHCARKVGWKNGGPITMLSEKDSVVEELRIKKRLYNEPRNIFTN